MSDPKQWFWWAGRNEEEFNLAGPCPTREHAINEAYGDTEPGDIICLVEAYTSPDEEEDPCSGLTPFTEQRNASHVVRGDDDEPDAKPTPTPAQVERETREADAIDAARFRALMRCPRIKMQGSAGVDPVTGALKYPNQPGSVHFGAEFWTTPTEIKWSESEPTWGRHALRALADDIIAVEAAAIRNASPVYGEGE